ncbi:hypothetical protein ACFQY0_04910 [Haloferula chungangensis]|uniref:Lipoprotein n=1 Tax=Haloferula chungangensis TaxID=1048331 RepID=A0ABW2L2E0_9BACT
MKYSLVLATSLFFVSCGSDAPVPVSEQVPLNPARDFKPVSGEPTTDDIARFLAGRPVKHGETLSKWQRTSGDYHTHAMNFDYEWRTFAGKRTVRQANYYKDTLKPLLGSPSTIFYPFGGPDILYASSMFPNASTYVLIGLESVGSIPDVVSENPTQLLDRLSFVLDEPLRHGYFITKEMKVAPPVTPILLTSLGLMGARVDSAQSIDAGGYPGVEIRFKAANGGSKKVIYVSGNLSNSGLNGSFQSWLGSFSGSTAYFKAASYLMHDPAFSNIRNWVLSNCNAVLQDDSGIPFKYYDSSNWNTTLLGNYERPIPFFAKWKQSDLAAAYDSIGGQGPEIPFGSGYHLKMREANLQVFKRK